MISVLTDAVLTITGFLTTLLAVVILLGKGEKRLNRHLLAAFLLSKASLMIRWFCYRFDILSYDGSPTFFYISGAAFFLLAPLLFLYITSLCYKDFVLKKKEAAHLIPFCIIMLFSAKPLSTSSSCCSAP